VHIHALVKILFIAFKLVIDAKELLSENRPYYEITELSGFPKAYPTAVVIT
jgi:hypothetical protein